MKMSITAMVVLVVCASFGWMPCALADEPAKPDEVDTQYDSDPKSWGRVKLLVVPTYPADLLTAGVEGVVDVEVLVSYIGRVQTIREISSTPKNAAFEEATRAVLEYWGFVNPVSHRCIPVETVAQARLHFNIENGAPKIYLSHRAPVTPETKVKSKTRAPVMAKLVSTNRPEILRSVIYPVEARRYGVEADVAGIITVSRKTGTVVEVDAVAVEEQYGVPRNIYRSFERNALHALQRMTFEPIPDAPIYAKTRVCVPFSFRLQ